MYSRGRFRHRGTLLLTVTALIATAVGFAPDARAIPAPFVNVEPSTPNSQHWIVPGSTALVTGYYFTPGVTVSLTSADGVIVDPDVVADAFGRFSTTMQVSSTLPCAAPVTVSSTTSGSPAVRVEEVANSTQCQLTFDGLGGSISVGFPFPTQGSGFAAGEPVTLSSDSGQLSPRTVTAGPDGTWRDTEGVRAPIRPHLVTLTATGVVSGRHATGSVTVDTDVLWAGDALQQYDQMVSANRVYNLYLGGQSIYIQDSYLATVVGGPARSDRSSAVLSMQTDGNLVMYANHRAVWSTHTAGTGPNNRLVLQNDGNLVLYSGARALWATGHPTLTAGRNLLAGQSIYPLKLSPRLVMQSDGNLVLYGGRTAIWNSRTFVRGSYLAMQTDGNLVIYSPAHRAVWNTHTARSGSGCALTVQDDGNLVLYSGSGLAVWSTHSRGRA